MICSLILLRLLILQKLKSNCKLMFMEKVDLWSAFFFG